MKLECVPVRSHGGIVIIDASFKHFHALGRRQIGSNHAYVIDMPQNSDIAVCGEGCVQLVKIELRQRFLVHVYFRVEVSWRLSGMLSGAGLGRGAFKRTIKAANGCLNVNGVKLDSENAAVAGLGGNKGGAGAAKRVKHKIAWTAEAINEREQRLNRFLRGMESVARILPLQNIGQRLLRNGRPAFNQQQSLFMLVSQEPHLGSVLFLKDNVPDRVQAGLPDCGQEFVAPRPSKKDNAKGISAQNPIHFAEGRYYPLTVIIVRYRLSITRAIVDQIGWIGEDKVDTFRIKPLHDANAISLDDAGRWN
jgi:hypothetical protein